ncbi:MAG: Fic family protein [Bacteroidota bacterium]
MNTLSSYQSGRFEKRNNYRVFIPNQINTDWLIDDPKVLALSSEAHHAIGRLDAYGSLIDDIDQFIRLIVVKEATESSRIEGTYTEVEEVYLPDGELTEHQQLDREEVSNYIEALFLAQAEMERLPISTRLLRIIHKRLMKGVRGKNKTPGEFRRSQVWIGGRTPDTAVIVPPPWEEIERLLGDLEYFIHSQEILLPPLIRIAITHYQFEAIHPFLDGNGRTGRLLIVMQLLDAGLLSQPTLYLSDFIDKHRSLYYDNLAGVSHNNDLRAWLIFFLDGVKVSAQKSAQALETALRLKRRLIQQLSEEYNKPQVALNLLNYLFTRPVVSRDDLINDLVIPPTSANRLLNRFEALGILKEITGLQRNRIFAFRLYLNIFR